jgi:hypothetical protein
MSRDVES